MADNFQQQDASMEEILSSIRKILSSEDDVKKSYPKKSDHPEEPLELVEAAETEEDAPKPKESGHGGESNDKTFSPENNSKNSEDHPKQPWEKEVHSAFTAHENVMPNTRLVSQSTLAASNAALSELTKHVKSDASQKDSSANTSVEDLLKSMLTPLLKDWLDKNLPTVIEKVVREEVRAIVNNASK